METDSTSLRFQSPLSVHRLQPAGFARQRWILFILSLMAGGMVFLLLARVLTARGEFQSGVLVSSIVALVFTVHWTISSLKQGKRDWTSFRLLIYENAVVLTRDDHPDVVIPNSDIRSVTRVLGGHIRIQSRGEAAITIPLAAEEAEKLRADLEELRPMEQANGVRAIVDRFENINTFRLLLAVGVGVWLIFTTHAYSLAILGPLVVWELVRNALRLHKSPRIEDELQVEWVGFSVMAVIITLKVGVVLVNTFSGL